MSVPNMKRIISCRNSLNYTTIRTAFILHQVLPNLEIIQSIYRVCMLCANTMPFYKRYLSIHGFWYPQQGYRNTKCISKYMYISQTHTKISKYTSLHTFKWPDEHYRNLRKLFRTANDISWDLNHQNSSTNLSQSSQKL